MDLYDTPILHSENSMAVTAAREGDDAAKVDALVAGRVTDIGQYLGIAESAVLFRRAEDVSRSTSDHPMRPRRAVRAVRASSRAQPESTHIRIIDTKDLIIRSQPVNADGQFGDICAIHD
jgi:hypothetical protein